MATQVTWRRGNLTQHGAFTGANGEVTILVDDAGRSIGARIHDGVTVGGIPIGTGSGLTSGVYDSFAEMIVADLSGKNKVSTAGYYAEYPGIGSGDYVKTALTGVPGETDGGGYFNEADGSRWELVPTQGAISYVQFGADHTGVNDCWQALYNCHAYANEKRYAVSQHFGTFYPRAQASEPFSIIIKTNCYLGGSYMLLKSDSGYPGGDLIYNFEIQSYKEPISLTPAELTDLNTTFVSSLRKESTKLPTVLFSAYKNAGVRLDGGADIIRSTGVTLNKGELCAIADNGGLKRPLSKDYTDGVTACTIYPADDSRLIYESPGWILAGVEDVRALIVRNRHNVTIKDAAVVEIVPQPATVSRRTFIAAVNAYDVEWNNIRGEAWTQTDPPEGLYLLGGNFGEDWRYINCHGTHGWGATGLNYIKGITFKDCSLNRYDIHWAAYDILIENCDMHNWGVLASGGNQLTIRDCRYYLANSSSVVGDSPQYAVMQTRIDYGSEWDGDITVDGLEIIIGADFTNLWSKDLSVVKFPFTSGNTDFGRPTVLGRTISVSNVRIRMDDPTRFATINKQWVMVDYEFGENTNNDYFIAHTINVDNCAIVKTLPNMAILAYQPPKHYGDRIKALSDALDVADGDYNQVVNISRINNCVGLKTSLPNTKLEIVKFGGDLTQADAGWSTRVDALRPQINIDMCNGVSAAIAVNGNVNITNSEVMVLDDVATTRPTDLFVRLNNCKVRMLDNGTASNYLIPLKINIDNSLFYKARTAAGAVHTLDFAKWSASSGYEIVKGTGNRKATGFLSSNDPAGFFV